MIQMPKLFNAAVVSGIVLIMVLILAPAGIAGDLQPAESPAPTMRTLGEIYDQIQTLSASPDAIPSDSVFGVSTGINMTIEGAETQGDIQGSCTIEGREDTITVVGVEHDVSIPTDVSGLPTGTRVHHPVVVTKYFDKATPRLYSALVAGESLSNVIIRFYRKDVSNAEIHYFTIELQHAKIIEITSSTPNFEKVSFIYQTITWTHEQDGIESQDNWTGDPHA